jgi:eukaryotic-like serine/threonine-protein kinase
MLKAPPGAGWEFDKFRLLPDKRLLLSDGAPVPLMAKAFDTLVLLLEKRDRVVSKDELLHAIWPGVVVEEGNLTQQIFLLRKALGESAQHPRYILTVPGHGYRFTAPVKEIVSDIRPTGEEAVTTIESVPRVSPWTQRRVLFAVVLGSILAAALVLAFIFQGTRLPTEGKWLDPAAVRMQKITETGRATEAAISPDGRYVAYVESEGDGYSLHVQQITTGGKTQVIPRQSHVLTYLRFSPDGEFLYFARSAAISGGFVLARVPAIGGPETPVLDNVDTPISFSPDGRHFVFMRGAGPETHIVLAEAGGGTQRNLATRKTPVAFSFMAPAWSPDGKWVAASMTDQSKGGRSSIVLLPVASNDSIRELYTTDDRIGALRWLPDGSGLVTVVSETLTRQFPPGQGNFTRLSGGSIWRIAFPGGAAERLTSDLSDYDLCCIDVAADGRTIAGVLNSLVSDLWIAPAGRLDAPMQITWGNPVIARHSWLPDNDTIVYRDLSGRLNAVHKDRRTFSLAVPDGHKVAGGVSACGNGSYVVFQAVPGNNIWRVTPTVGGATRLTSGHLDSNPACSPDGKWVVYSSMRQGVPSTWRISIEGGEPAPLASGQTLEALPSPGGRLIYYSAFEWDEHPVRLRRLRWIVISSGDGKRLFSVAVPPDKAMGTVAAWAPDESGLDYVVTRNGVSNIWRQPLTGGPPVQVTHYSASKIFSFAWSPDGRWLSLGSGINRSDVVLISRK